MSSASLFPEPVISLRGRGFDFQNLKLAVYLIECPHLSLALQHREKNFITTVKVEHQLCVSDLLEWNNNVREQILYALHALPNIVGASWYSSTVLHARQRSCLRMVKSKQHQ